MYLTEPYDHEFEFNVEYANYNYWVHFVEQLEHFWRIYFPNLIFKLEMDENKRGCDIRDKIIIYKNNNKEEYKLEHGTPSTRIGEIDFERVIQDRRMNNYIDVMVLYLGDKKYKNNAIVLKSFEHLKCELEQEIYFRYEHKLFLPVVDYTKFTIDPIS